MDFSSSSVFDQHKGKSRATNFKILWSSNASHANVLRLLDRINNIHFWEILGLFWFHVKEFLPSVLDWMDISVSCYSDFKKLIFSRIATASGYSYG